MTVGMWDKGEYGDAARRFMEKVSKMTKAGECRLVVPTTLLQLLRNWRHQWLREEIEMFYLQNCSELIERVDILEGFIARETDFEAVFMELVAGGAIKEEDVLLIFAASIKKAELYTFNKVHLRNNREKINEVLSKHGLPAIEIRSP